MEVSEHRRLVNRCILVYRRSLSCCYPSVDLEGDVTPLADLEGADGRCRCRGGRSCRCRCRVEGAARARAPAAGAGTGAGLSGAGTGAGLSGAAGEPQLLLPLCRS